MFPAPSNRLPLSVRENLVTVLGTFSVNVTVIDAPMASGPSAAGIEGLAKVTVPVPLRVRAVI